MAVSAVARKAVAPASASRSARVQVVCQAGVVQRVQAAAATAVVAALLASPAQAGVVLVKPELKKLFQDDGSAPAAVSTSSSSSKVSAPKAPKVKAEPGEPSIKGNDIDPRIVALPGSIALVALGGVAWSKMDSGFADFFKEAACKDSTDFAGYEPELKPEGGYTGTRKVKAKGIKGLFGK